MFGGVYVSLSGRNTAIKNIGLKSYFAVPNRTKMAEETVASDTSVGMGDTTDLSVKYRALRTAAILIDFLMGVSLIICC